MKNEKENQKKNSFSFSTLLVFFLFSCTCRWTKRYKHGYKMRLGKKKISNMSKKNEISNMSKKKEISEMKRNKTDAGG